MTPTDDDLLTADPAVMHDLDVEGKTEELLADDNDLESWSDDPVRMYLYADGRNPCCSRASRKSLLAQAGSRSRGPSSAASCSSATM